MSEEENLVIDAEFSLNVSNTDHSLLLNRNLPNQHEISSITGLQSELDNRGATLSYEQSKLSLLNTQGNVLSEVTIESGGISNLDGGTSTSVYLISQKLDCGDSTEGDL